MTTHFTAAIKLLVLVAILLFISQTTSFNSSSSDEHHQLTQKDVYFITIDLFFENEKLH